MLDAFEQRAMEIAWDDYFASLEPPEKTGNDFLAGWIAHRNFCTGAVCGTHENTISEDEFLESLPEHDS